MDPHAYITFRDSPDVEGSSFFWLVLARLGLGHVLDKSATAMSLKSVAGPGARTLCTAVSTKVGRSFFIVRTLLSRTHICNVQEIH